MDYKEIVTEVAREMNIPLEDAIRAYRCYWKRIREIMTGIPMFTSLTEEEVKDLRVSVSLWGLGKLGFNYRKCKHNYKYFKPNNKKNGSDKESKTAV